jgi:subtilisin family serine protease
MRHLPRLSVLAACVGASVAIAATGVALAVTPAPSIGSAGDGGAQYRTSERANVHSWFEPRVGSWSRHETDFAIWTSPVEFATEDVQIATPRGVRDRADAVLVKFEARDVSATMRRRALDEAGAQANGARRVKGLPNVWRVPVDEDATPAKVANRLDRYEDVVWAVADVPATTEVMPNDPLFTDLWGLSNTGQQVQATPPFTGLAGVDLGALGAWGTTQGSADVPVAVVDSGVVMDHPDLEANLRATKGRNFVPDAEGVVDPLGYGDTHSHGTHVAGTIGAVGNNGLGVTGVNWTVDMTSVRVCDFTGSCGYTAEGLAYAGGQARVVNASVGGGGTGEADTDAIRQHPNTLFVAAAGNDANDNDETPQYPCNVPLPNVLCVAAIDASGELASFSNYGARTVDIAAPGVGILSTVPAFATAFAPAIEPSDETPPLPVGWTQDPADQWTAGELSNGLHYLDLSATAREEGEPNGNGLEIWTIQAPGTFEPVGESCRLNAFIATDLDGDYEQLQAYYVTDRAPNTPILAGAVSGDTRGGFEAWNVDLSGVRGATWAKLRFAVVRVTGESDRTSLEVKIAIPEVRCIVDQPAGGSYDFMSGTSMAAPQVAGAAALLLAKNPTLTAVQLKRALLSTAVPMASLTGKVTTGGRLDANAALASVAAASAPVSTSPVKLTGEVPCVATTCLATGTAPADATLISQSATSRPGGSTVTGTCTIKQRTASASSTYACTVRLTDGTWIITTTASTPSGKIASFSKRVTVATRPVAVTG